MRPYNQNWIQWAFLFSYNLPKEMNNNDNLEDVKLYSSYYTIQFCFIMIVEFKCT